MKLFYRLANNQTEQGLWYDFEGEFTGAIHDEFNFCMNTKLPMPYDKNIVGWLSATMTLDDLFKWFSRDDIGKLEKYGYRVAVYKASEYKFYNGHWLIKQDSSRLKERITLDSIN